MTQARAEAEEEVVWQVCPYLRHNKPYWAEDDACKRCPRWEPDPTEPGEVVQRGCFALAHEVVMISRTGNPWGRIL